MTQMAVQCKVPVLKSRARNRDGIWAFLFIAPNLMCFVAFTVIPVIWAAIMSLTDWKIIGAPKWVGLSNYIELFTRDTVFSQVFSNTLIFMAVSVPVGMVLSLLVAMLLNTNIAGKRMYRGFFFIPVISSGVLVSVIWKWLLVDQFGLVNYLLSFIGVDGPSWLTDKRFALPAVIMVSIWKNLGFNMLLFLAGLQSIPDVYYEAYQMDSNSWFRRTWNITLPLLAPTTFFVTTMSIINSFQVFDIVKMMTNGGPGRTTSVMVHYLYQNAFEFFRMGYASAIAYVLFFVILLVTILQFHFNNQNDYSLS